MAVGGKLTEAQIQNQVRSYLAALGIDAVHVPNGSHIAGNSAGLALRDLPLGR